jgi:hypothetical protein
MCDDGTCRDDAPFTYIDATKDDTFSTDPAAVSNSNWLSRTSSSSTRPITNIVTTGDELDTWTDIATVTNVDVCIYMSINNNPWA